MIQSKYGPGIRFEARVEHRCFISDVFNGGLLFCCMLQGILPNYLVHHFKPGERAL